MVKIVIGVGLLAFASLAVWATVGPLSPPTIKLVLPDEQLDGNDAKHVLIGVATFPKNGATRRHSHAGDEYATVLSGAIEVTDDGEGSRVYRTGEAYHNHRGVVHVARNAYKGTSVVNFVMVIDKGAPPQVLAPGN
jgi:quercetin dioxygenase-like cupin family protein